MIMTPKVRTVARIAPVVAICYYIGVQVGLMLRFPPATTSVLWPPNSILTAALLLTPVKWWWLCLAGALPVHYLMQTAVGWTPAFVVAIFLTNCSEALIAAGFIRAYSDAPDRFDTLRRVAVFIVGAGFIAPVLSSFADAAVVEAFRGDPFWTVWRTRLFANSLSGLSVVPLVVLAARHRAAPIGGVSVRKFLEASLLGCALVAVAALSLGSAGVGIDVPGLGLTSTPLDVLPLFFWAAIRFGAGGMSTGLLIVALTASFAARTGNRPFDGLDPAESLQTLQAYLVIMATPLFALTALLDERRRAIGELARRLQFEALLSELSASFVHTPSDRMIGAFDVCLQRTGEFFGVDRVAIMQLSASGKHLLLSQWSAEGVARLPSSYPSDMFPWGINRLLSGEEVICESIDDFPKDAFQDRSSFIHLNLSASLVIPLMASGAVQGAMSFHMVRSARTWPEGVVAQVRIVAELLASALDRKQTDDALRSSESMKTAILSSLSSLVAVLDKNGVVIAVNKRWLELPRHEALLLDAVSEGVSYVDVCRQAAARGDRSAAEALPGVESVLGGRVTGFSLEYRHSNHEERWYAMSVVPLQRADGGAVVSHVEVTERKRAEFEAQRARQDLSHFTRVSTMGQLTASLAHQLNQPLAGILSNAQAARRMLDVDHPDLSAVRDTVIDIIDDDRRAGEVIRRMRDMMTKASSDPVITDANALIRDVVMLTRSDTIIRNVALMLDLAPETPHVRGDRIELQQVILNLLVNAMDAVTDQPLSRRAIVVRSEHLGHESVLVSVKDSGPGLRPGTEANIFEPFFTTKPAGMGMGLAIARSIVESYGGRIWAANNGEGGATFFVRLPLARDRAA